MNIIVGNNEAGKSTILEAINLAFSGYVKGKNIRNELSESYINRDIVNTYIQAVKSGSTEIPPEIVIEVYLGASCESGEDEHYIAALNGAYNSDGDIHASGFKFYVSFNEELFGDEYNTLLATADLTLFDSVPIEYYDSGWRDFSDNPITPRSILSSGELRAEVSANCFRRSLRSDHAVRSATAGSRRYSRTFSADLS